MVHMEPQTGNKNKVLYFLIIIIIFLTLTAFLFWLFKQNKNSLPKNEEESIVEKKTAFFKIRTENNLLRSAKDNDLSLLIEADSDNKDISGADIILLYDKNSFQLVRVEEEDKDFNLVSLPKEGCVIFTLNKLLQKKTPAIWKEKLLAKVIFKPLKTGRFLFSIKSSLGKEKTQMVDVNNQIIIPEVDEQTIEIY